MYLEVVQFGNGKAIEVRDILTKATLFLHFVGILGLSKNVSEITEEDTDMNSFTNECLEVIKRHTKYQWIMFCSDIEIFGDDSGKFDHYYRWAFEQEDLIREPADDEESQLRASNSSSGKLKPRVWILNLKTEQVYGLYFNFADPIFSGSALEGMIVPTDTSTEFHIREVNHWCGGDHTLATSSKQFIRQQLNVWFYSGDWFQPSSISDSMKFYVDIPDEDVPRGIEGTLPVLSENDLNDWNKQNRIHELRVFRLYKTQYPFIYSLMPDDSDRVNELKTAMKTSSDKEIKLKPLLATVLTAESQLIIHNAFYKAGKNMQYLRWKCAR